MSIVKIAGKKFKLASRWARLGAFIIDVGLIGLCHLVLYLSGPFADVDDGRIIVFYWICALLFMDGLRAGGGFGKRLLSLQTVRLKDGEPANFKDSFIRRFAGIFQPLDWLFTFGKERQRIGDKLAKTVVVKLDSPHVEFVSDSETEEKDIEKVLESVILEITNQFSEAKHKVDASIGIEKQFQNAHEGATSQAKRCEERAIISLEAGREDLAREDLAQRNKYNQLADRYKEQWEEQKQAVEYLKTLLDTLQQKTHETQREREIVMAQHKNVDAHEHLNQTLNEIRDNKAFEMLKKMGQNVSEAAALAKAAAEVDLEFRDVKLNREYADFAEDESIDKEIAKLKSKLQ